MLTKLPPQLTARQQQVLDFLRAFYAKNDQLPPARSICDHFGWKSDNAAQTFTSILEAKGYIEKNEVGKYRFTRTEHPAAVALDTLPGALVRLPVVEASGIPVRRFMGA